MKQSWLGKLSLAALGAALLAAGAVRAESPARVVVVSETGKPERRCIIERTQVQPDGSKVHLVRDLVNGERMRVIDSRPTKTGGGPLLGQALARLTGPSDAGMSSALSATPFAYSPVEKRVPTLTEQAAGANAKGGAVRTGLFRFLER